MTTITTSVNTGNKININRSTKKNPPTYTDENAPSYSNMMYTSKCEHKIVKFPNTSKVSSIMEGTEPTGSDVIIAKLRSSRCVSSQPLFARTTGIVPIRRSSCGALQTFDTVPQKKEKIFQSSCIIDLYHNVRDFFITHILFNRLRLTVHEKAKGKHKVFECEREMIELSMGYFKPVIESHKKKILMTFNKKFPEDNIPDDLREQVLNVLRAATHSGSGAIMTVKHFTITDKKEFDYDVTAAKTINEPVVPIVPITGSVSKVMLVAFYTGTYDGAKPSSMTCSPPPTKLAINVNCDIVIFEWLYHYSTYHYYKNKNDKIINAQCEKHTTGGSERKRLGDELETVKNFKNDTIQRTPLTTSPTLGGGVSLGGDSDASHTVYDAMIDKPPVLEISNVTSLILSSKFLGMMTLHNEACSFFYKNLGEVLLSDTNLDCLCDNVGNMMGISHTTFQDEFLQPEHILEACLYIAQRGCSNTSKLLQQVAGTDTDTGTNKNSKEAMQMLEQQVREAIYNTACKDADVPTERRRREATIRSRASSTNGKKKKITNNVPSFNPVEAERIMTSSYEFHNRHFLGNLICKATVHWLEQGCCPRKDSSKLPHSQQMLSRDQSKPSNLKQFSSRVVSPTEYNKNVDGGCNNKDEKKHDFSYGQGKIDFCTHCGVLFSPILKSETGNSLLQRCPARANGIIGVHGEVVNEHVGRNQKQNIDSRNVSCFCQSKDFETLRYILLTLYNYHTGEMKYITDATKEDPNTHSSNGLAGWNNVITSIKEALDVKTCLTIPSSLLSYDSTPYCPEETKVSAKSDIVLHSNCVDSILASETHLIPIQLFFKSRPVELLCILLWMQLATAAPTLKSIEEEKILLNHDVNAASPRIGPLSTPSTPPLTLAAPILLLRNHPILHTFSLRGFTALSQNVMSSPLFSFRSHSIIPWLLASRLLIPRKLEKNWSSIFYYGSSSSGSNEYFSQHPSHYFITTEELSIMYRSSASAYCKNSTVDRRLLFLNCVPGSDVSSSFRPANVLSRTIEKSLWMTLTTDVDFVKNSTDCDESDAVVLADLNRWSAKAIAPTVLNRRRAFAALLKCKIDEKRNRIKVRSFESSDSHKRQERQSDKNRSLIVKDDGLGSSVDGALTNDENSSLDETVVLRNNEIMSFSPQSLLVDLSASREQYLLKQWRRLKEEKYSVYRNDPVKSGPPSGTASSLITQRVKKSLKNTNWSLSRSQ